MKNIMQWIISLFLITLLSVAVYPNTLLHILYNNRIGITLRQSLITKPIVSKTVGKFADAQLSRWLIKPYIKKYKVNIQEAIRTKPSEYSSLNDLFTRKLKPKMRPINQNSAAIISPADGLLYTVETVTPKTELFIKGKLFDIKKFLQNKQQAERFYGGILIIIYLSPADYHRFHFPCDGIPSNAISINGIYESVQPIAFNAGVQSLTENERQLVLIKTKDYGTIAFVSVGALCVGRITHTYKPGQYYAKGEEAGYFSFGGSTLVLLFEKGKIKLTKKSMSKENSIPIKMGQQIAIKK